MTEPATDDAAPATKRDLVNQVIRRVKKYRVPLIVLVVVGALLLWGPTIYANLSTRDQRYDLGRTAVQDIPKNKVAIVFGAGITSEGIPTPYLQWRVETAAKLYKAGRVEKLLMTGDNTSKGYDEPTAMRNWALKFGVKKQDIVLDYAGLNTYDSCYRAHAIFKLDRATLVTQGYHLPRAVMACDGLGVKSIGVNSIRRGADSEINYITREWVSTDKITLQLLFKPQPTVLGRPEPID